jgi:hypothetical protein
LPDPLLSQKSGSVLLYFRAFGYAKKDSFGAYNYVFETLKVDDTIRNLRVGISPDSDLYMKGAKGTVDYFKDSAPVFESAKPMAVGSSFQNSSVDNAIQNIGYGVINKNSSNLMPLDSYKVKGSYADSRTKLYAGPMILVVAVVLIVLTVLVFGVWRIVRTLKKKSGAPDSLSTGTSRTRTNLALSIGMSFVSASLVSILIFLAYFFLKFMSSWSNGGDVGSILYVFVMLVIVGIIGVFLLFPCILIGVKRGVWWGLATFVFTLFWLFVAFLIMSVVLMGFSRNSISTPPYPVDLKL